MSKRFAIAVCVACVVFASSSLVRASSISLVEVPLDTLLGSSYSAVGSTMTTPMVSGNLVTQVFSQAYVNDAGLYAYLYQVDNIGVTGNSAAEMFTVGMFGGPMNGDEVGYLSGTIPTGFNSGGQSPELEGYVDSITGGLEISFYYTKREGYQIDVGENSRVMYVVSHYAPGVVVGSVINGTSVSGPVVGAVVPEPVGLWRPDRDRGRVVPTEMRPWTVVPARLNDGEKR